MGHEEEEEEDGPEPPHLRAIQPLIPGLFPVGVRQDINGDQLGLSRG